MEDDPDKGAIRWALRQGRHAPTPKPSESGPVFLGIKNVTDDGCLTSPRFGILLKTTFASWTRRVEPRANDLVFTYEATLNRYAIIPQGFRGCLGRANGPNPDKPVDSRCSLFLLYYFFTDEWRSVIRRNVLTGATVDRIPLTTFPNFPVRVPPLSVQKRIAEILGGYDELIKNSQQRIQILESMARILYREWFVHFRFPNHGDHARVRTQLGEIPRGWSTSSLDAVKADRPYAMNGGPFGSKLGTRDYVENGVPVIRGSNLDESGRFDDDAFVFVSNAKADELRANIAVPGDIVVTQREALGQIGMIPSGIGYDKFVISQSQMKITLNREAVSPEYVFFYLRSEEAARRIRNLASSSGVPHINLAVLREFHILVPPYKLQRAFGEFASATESAIETLRRQIRNLRRTRDLLLPRLMSGQISPGKAA